MLEIAGVTPSVGCLPQKAINAAEKRVEVSVQKFFNNFSELITVAVVGRPAQKILEVADQEKVDVPIMGTHGRKALEYTMWGRVCREVLRDAPCPVAPMNPQKALSHR